MLSTRAFRFAVLSVLVMIVATILIIVVAPRAHAACTNEVNTRATYRNVDDDESSSYVRFYESVYFNSCGLIRFVRVGFAPDTRHNARLSCNSAVFDKARMNMGAIAGINPPTRTLDCAPLGRYADTPINRSSSGDHCAGTHIVVDKNLLPDRTYDMVQVCSG